MLIPVDFPSFAFTYGKPAISDQSAWHSPKSHPSDATFYYQQDSEPLFPIRVSLVASAILDFLIISKAAMARPCGHRHLFLIRES